MIVGTVKEIKNNENRVGLTPRGVEELRKQNIQVLVQKSSGIGSGFSDEEYARAGAMVLSSAKEVFEKSDIIVKVKEPLPEEFPLLRSSQILFTYFHFASSPSLTNEMVRRGITCIAYETVEKNNRTVLLDPMSEVAGRMAPMMAAYYLAKPQGGMGKLSSGTDQSIQVSPAKLVILGGGMVGENALKIGLGLGFDCTLFELSAEKITQLKQKYPLARILASSESALEKELVETDALVGAVYLRGAHAPSLVSEAQVKRMRKGSVIVDVAIDQGGCVATSSPTTHANPIYEKFGVVHYCVANMPGAYPRTSTFALTTATLPYVITLALKGLQSFRDDAGWLKGLNVFQGKVTNQGVAQATRIPFVDPAQLCFD